MLATILAQINATVADTTQVAAATSTSQGGLSFFDLVLKGGLIMIPIGLLSLWSLYLIIERYLNIKRATKIDPAFLPGISQHLSSGNINAANSLCLAGQQQAFPRIIQAGVASIGQPIKDIEGTLETIANIEVKELEKNMEYLGLIAGVAPMLGFIGTISGIIKIFYNISITENISIGVIAGGLYEKMLTSGAGLAVGIFAYCGYHLLNSIIDRFTLKVEKGTFEFVKIIKSPSGR